jgi:hypothetical protein
MKTTIDPNVWIWSIGHDLQLLLVNYAFKLQSVLKWMWCYRGWYKRSWY